MAFWNPKNQFDLKPTRRQSYYLLLNTQNPIHYPMIPSTIGGGGGGGNTVLPPLSLST